MIDAVLRSMIGSWGNWLLDQYIANALWINGLILIYALLVMLARRNFKITLQFFLEYLQKEYGTQLQGKNKRQVTKFLSRVTLPWQAALQNVSLPLIASPHSVRVYLTTESTLRKIFQPEILAEAFTRQ